MGSFAMIGIFFCLYKSVKSLIEYFSWKQKNNTTATVIELIDTKANLTKRNTPEIASTEYKYLLRINHDTEDFTTEYNEVINGDNPSKLHIGSSFPVLLDINTKQFKRPEDIKDDLWVWPVCTAVCVVLLVVSIVLSLAIS